MRSHARMFRRTFFTSVGCGDPCQPPRLDVFGFRFQSNVFFFPLICFRSFQFRFVYFVCSSHPRTFSSGSEAAASIERVSCSFAKFAAVIPHGTTSTPLFVPATKPPHVGSLHVVPTCLVPPTFHDPHVLLSFAEEERRRSWEARGSHCTDVVRIHASNAPLWDRIQCPPFVHPSPSLRVGVRSRGGEGGGGRQTGGTWHGERDRRV